MQNLSVKDLKWNELYTYFNWVARHLVQVWMIWVLIFCLNKCHVGSSVGIE